MAIVGEATITGVPASELPQASLNVQRIQARIKTEWYSRMKNAVHVGA
jgi:hypothetical protein